MKPVKACYRIKFFMKRKLGIEVSNFLFVCLITWYYRVFKNKKKGIKQENKRNRKLIVSITSIPLRTDKLWITMESLLRQTYKPDKIILWLAKDEFQNVKLPERLREQQKRGIEIRYCANLRSYKKFYYTAKAYPDDYIVTVDDDIIFAEDMLEILVKTYRENPGGIVCQRSHYIKKYGGRLRPYTKWLGYEDRTDIDSTYSFQNFFTSGAGTLFPMFRLKKVVLQQEIFMKLAPYADDVWLNFCAWKAGIKTMNVKGSLGNIITIGSSSRNGLFKINAIHQKNDEQIERVLEYLRIDVNQFL